MCIIAVKPEGTLLKHEQLLHMWSENPHGAGFMYAKEGRLVVVRGIMKFKDLFFAIREHGMARKMVIHFRWRTHGPKDPTMTHPFWIEEGKLAMVHNGVISAVSNETTSMESDTCVFARKLTEAYADPLTAISHPFHKAMIESYIGKGNKLVFMDNAGETYIFNESAGIWNEGVWYSNSDYKPREIVQPSPNLPSFFEFAKRILRERPDGGFEPAKKKKNKKARRHEQRSILAQHDTQKPILGLGASTKRWYEYDDAIEEEKTMRKELSDKLLEKMKEKMKEK